MPGLFNKPAVSHLVEGVFAGKTEASQLLLKEPKAGVFVLVNQDGDHVSRPAEEIA